MELSQAARELRDRFFKTMLEAAFPLQTGSDPTRTLRLSLWESRDWTASGSGFCERLSLDECLNTIEHDFWLQP
jgi:hypothetical protein